jgi:4-hydroxybenzoate polyprenyltransferase
MAFAAVTGGVPWLAWALLVGNLFWVVAYDTEYAMVDRDDDLKIGIRTSAITFGRFDVCAVMGLYGLYLAVWGVLCWQQGYRTGLLLGLAAALAQIVWHYGLIRSRSREGCFLAFRQNHWVGLAVFLGLLIDPWLR